MNQLKYRVLGVMSGTSLDGLDLCLAEFDRKNAASFSIVECETIPYSESTVRLLQNAYSASGEELSRISIVYGEFLADRISGFLDKTNSKVDLIASHGHTVYHDPAYRKTVQIGNGPEIFLRTGIPVVCDFRVQDVLLGGQGAPLVPLGDDMLFGQYAACLNLGGFANISFRHGRERMAFDICPVNIVLNELSQKLGRPFDEDGILARTGNIDQTLLNQLNSLEFYQAKPPKSLGREWVEAHVQHLLLQVGQEDALATFVEHIATQIAKSTSHLSGDMLITGGGAFNQYLLERIQELGSLKVSIPDTDLINFKEALIFALLGLQRWTGQHNCLASVTGACENHSSGRIYMT